jgi:hypothetical protein
LLAQLHTDRIGRLDLTRDDREGRTVVHAGALTAAVEEEARSLRGVVGASARLVEDRARTLRLAVDDPELPVDVELRPGRRSGSRGLL